MVDQQVKNGIEKFPIDDQEVVEIQSLCMNCHADGTTRLMATNIPFYKEVVLMSFNCDSCGFENNELQNCGAISEKGIKIVLKVMSPKDLNRKCVYTEFSKIIIPEVELEIPKNQKGAVTTIEGVIDRVVSGLQQDQVARRIDHPDDAYKIDQFILRLVKLKDVEQNGPFKFIVEDISGNSYIENPSAPQKDDKLTITYPERSMKENHELGFFTQQELNGFDESEEDSINTMNGIKDTLLHPIGAGEHSLEELQQGEVLTFRTNCPDCNRPCDTNMKMTNIPHFKEVVIMATTCDSCGHRTNEVKSGGGIEPLGVRMEVKIRNKLDFSRDVLKSDTCSLIIPELELESGPRSLCGRFTTIEGLITAMRTQLAGKDSMFAGDSADPSATNRFDDFIAKLDQVIAGNSVVTLILDDPAGNSFVQTLTDDGTADEGVKITKYTRTYENDEELGLNDMKTDSY
ncbi:zinc finger protein Zpr1 [Arctopsyche grandis]|uniref:zinc finger protein Zpr1 n=1 Tax=Arctopsyche grandis TaxID=121162 RepID=UPI00406D6D6E